MDGLAEVDIKNGAPFRNSSDIVRKYTYNYVSLFNVVIIGQSDLSNFDIGF